MSDALSEGDWPDRLRLPLDFDAAPLAREADAMAGGAWTAHFVRQNYEGDWSVVPLRAPAGETHPIRMIYSDGTTTDYVDTPFLAAAPAFRAVISRFACPVRSVRLMRLAAGSVIKTHCDHDLDVAMGHARVHIPVRTSDAVDFRLNGTRVAMAPGSCWYLRLSDPHSVTNTGDADRVHLVVDLMVDGWLLGLFAAARAGSASG